MTVASTAYLGASDAFTWRMERDPALRSTIVVVDWLDCAPDWDALVARVDRISRLMPSLRQRVIESPFGLTAARWSYDPHFDLDWHIRRVAAPAPRTREAVMQFARRSAMGAFDRDRPLWELTLVEGIEDGEAALVLKLHHSLSDGVGGMRMRLTVPTGEPDPAVRMHLLHRITQAAREERSLPVTGAIAAALNVLPVGYVAAILKHADFVASNVPGVPVPVYVAGSKVTGMSAFGPTIGTALNTTLVSYADTCDIGINIDTAAVPDPHVLLACLEESAAEITALGGGE